jgi:hypothetical protein
MTLVSVKDGEGRSVVFDDAPSAIIGSRWRSRAPMPGAEAYEDVRVVGVFTTSPEAPAELVFAPASFGTPLSAPLAEIERAYERYVEPHPAEMALSALEVAVAE